MLALYVVLLTDAAADAAYSVFLKISKKDRRFLISKTLGTVFCIAFFVYGAVNMSTVKPVYHEFESSKLTSAHTVVFIADLHVGSAQPFDVTEKTVSDVRALAPDAVILGGDIVDDYTTKDEMERTFALFADFDAPVFYVYGNHDRQGHAEYAGGVKFTPEELENAMTSNGVTVLKDEWADIAPDLILLGREDLSEDERRTDIQTLSDPAPDKYLIVADHQPSAFKDNLSVGADLQLSGHTHAGQLFPLGVLYHAIGYCVGEYSEGDAVMVVSAGACGWRMPIRTQSRSSYEVIKLTPFASPES